jgi:hypothetical protein
MYDSYGQGTAGVESNNCNGCSFSNFKVISESVGQYAPSTACVGYCVTGTEPILVEPTIAQGGAFVDMLITCSSCQQGK